MSRQSAIDHSLASFDAGDFLAELARRNAIPTKSQEPEQLPQLYRHLEEEMRLAFAALGFNSRFMIGTGEENGSKGLEALVA